MMAASTDTTRVRFWLWLIRLIGVIVPRRLRADWRQEWEAELNHREALLAQWDRLSSRNKLDLLWRSTSAFWDAIWMQTHRWEDEMFQDIRYGARSLFRDKAFTSIALLTLALSIGANTAIFSLVDVVLLKQLPVKDPKRLIAIDSFNERDEQRNFSQPVFEQLREHTPVVGMLAASDWTTGIEMTALSGDQSERAEVQFVSGEYFEVLGVSAVVGRMLNAADDEIPGGHPLAVLSYSFWQRKFEGNASVIGQGITLKEQPFTIIGVAASGFFGEAVGRAPDIWVPMMMQPALGGGLTYVGEANTGWLRIMARLQPGTNVEQARAALGLSLERIKSESTPLGRSARNIARIELSPGDRGLAAFRTRFAQSLNILMAVVGLVLLIASANVANLQLARATSRQREVAIRMAIGAGRFRLIRQFLTESLLLSLGAGALGFWLATWGSRVLLILGSESSTPLPIDVGPNPRLLAFTSVIAVLTAILFGLAPALIITRQDVNSALKASSEAARLRPSLSRPLVVAQVAVSLLLLTGAGLFVGTLRNLRSVDLGFAAEQVVQARVSPLSSGYKREQLPELYSRLLERMNSVPGINSVSMSSGGFLTGRSRTCCINVQGHTHQPNEDRELQTLSVTPGYFSTIGLPLMMGRDFAPSDVSAKQGDSPKSAIINEAMARRYFGENAVGGRFGWGDQQVSYDFVVVGVVKDANYGRLREKTASLIYFPAQGESLLVVRAATDPTALLATVRREIAAVDSRLEISTIRTVPQLFDQALSQERMLAKLSSFFGLLALLLATIGLYGVVSYDVTRRTREIGIRMALGARRLDVLKMVLRETLWLVGIGLAIGLAASLATTRLIASLLFGVTEKDPFTLAMAAMSLLAVALFAGCLPARRATRVDPMIALRHE